MPRITHLPINRATEKRKQAARTYAIQAASVISNAGEFPSPRACATYTFLLQIQCLYPEICLSQQQIADRLGLSQKLISIVCIALKSSTYKGQPLLKVTTACMFGQKMGKKYECLDPVTGGYKHEFE